MHKKIALFLSIIFNLCIYSQVVIKDEIVLDDTGIYKGTESVSLVMPFYARVYSEIPCQWNHWTSGAIKITRTAGGQTQLDGCWPPFVCGSGSCFCSWGTRAHNFYGVAQGENISVEISRCYDPPPTPPNDAQWFDVPLQFNYVGNNKYDLYGQDIADGSWDYIGYFKFIATTPPGNCPNAGGNYCDSSSWVEVPDVELVLYPQGFTISNIECPKNPNRLAFFTPVLYPQKDRTNMSYLTSSDVIACYNQLGQTWQFNLNQSAKIYFVIEICSTNVSNKSLTYINSISDISIIPFDKCNIALKSFEGHLEYPYEIPNNGYVIKEALLFHENGHKEKFEDFKNDFLFLWETGIETFRAQCTTYANIFEAREAGLQMYNFVFSGYYNEFAKMHNKLLGLSPYDKTLKDKEENRVNNRPEMRALVNSYIEALKTRCEKN